MRVARGTINFGRSSPWHAFTNPFLYIRDSIILFLSATVAAAAWERCKSSLFFTSVLALPNTSSIYPIHPSIHPSILIARITTSPCHARVSACVFIYAHASTPGKMMNERVYGNQFRLRLHVIYLLSVHTAQHIDADVSLMMLP